MRVGYVSKACRACPALVSSASQASVDISSCKLCFPCYAYSHAYVHIARGSTIECRFDYYPGSLEHFEAPCMIPAGWDHLVTGHSRSGQGQASSSIMQLLLRKGKRNPGCTRGLETRCYRMNAQHDPIAKRKMIIPQLSALSTTVPRN